MINFKFDNNKLIVHGKVVQLNNVIDNVVEFNDMIIVMLMDEEMPENNIIAFNEFGNKIWGISSIIVLPYDETYVSISRVDDDSISVISYNGLETYIDIRKRSVISKIIINYIATR